MVKQVVKQTRIASRRQNARLKKEKKEIKAKRQKERYAKEHKILAQNIRIVSQRVAREENAQVRFL